MRPNRSSTTQGGLRSWDPSVISEMVRGRPEDRAAALNMVRKRPGRKDASWRTGHAVALATCPARAYRAHRRPAGAAENPSL